MEAEEGMSLDFATADSAQIAIVSLEEARGGWAPSVPASFEDAGTFQRRPRLAGATQPVRRMEQPVAAPSAAERWLSYLAKLHTPEIGLAERHAGAVRALWQELVDRVGPELRTPAAGPGGDLGFHLAWSYPDVYVSVEVAPDGRIEWFFKDLQTGEKAGSGDEEELTSPPEPLVRILTARCLRRA